MGFEQLRTYNGNDNLVVVDNSVVMRWLFNDGSNKDQEYARKVLKQTRLNKKSLLVPSLWVYEAAFVVNAYVLREAITPQQAREKLDNLFALCNVITINDSPTALFNYSNKYKISSYDAGYALLAQNLNCPLASLDKKLIKAVKQSGGKLF